LAGKKKIGDMLIEAGLITEEQLGDALSRKAPGQRIGQALVSLVYVAEESMAKVLASQYDMDYVPLGELDLSRELARLVPRNTADRYTLVPVKLNNRRLTVAVHDPLNVIAADDLSLLTGCDIDVVVSTESDVKDAISRLYDDHRPQPRPTANVAASVATVVTDVEDNPIVKKVNRIIEAAARARASDIHIEPDENGLRVRYRVDGVLREIERLPGDENAPAISRLKILGGMDISEHRLPQDGGSRFSLANGQQINLRINTLPTVFGEKAVIRLLNVGGLLTLDQLGMSPSQRAVLEGFIHQPYGMILVTGPTGSGKTTTLYAALQTLNQPEKNLVTIEDPVETRLPGVNQIQVNPKSGLTYASVLMAVLRQDPNTVMVGEIRDSETADVAVRAALTGHLVLATLHTNDAPSAATRLMDMGVEPFLIASSLVGVVAQRLVRRVCPHCRQPIRYEAGSPEGMFGGEHAYSVGQGCPMCGGTGYNGRLGVYELFTVNNDIRPLIVQRASADELRAKAKAGGMVSLADDALAKAREGLTTVPEVMMVAFQQ
jgi:type IV pilus assembly protein PilB